MYQLELSHLENFLKKPIDYERNLPLLELARLLNLKFISFIYNFIHFFQFQAERASLRAPLLMRNPNSERPEIIDDNSEYDYNDAKYSGSSYDYENADDMKNSVPYYE